MNTIQIPTYQPITYRRDNTFNNQSSQEELQILLSAITQWRLKYDPNDELFPEIWDQENEKFQSHISNTVESKEEEPSPIHFISNTENNDTFFTCDGESNKYDLITSEITQIQQQTEESDEPDFDPMEDTETWNEMEKIKQQNLNKTKAIKHLYKKQGLNKQAKEFIPSNSSQRLDVIDELATLDNKTEETEQTQPIPPTTAHNHTTNVISTHMAQQIPFNQYIVPNATIINTVNINMIPTTSITHPLSNINSVPVQSLNQQINVSNQSKTVNQFNTLHTQATQHGNIKTECKVDECSNDCNISNIIKDMDDEIFEPIFEPKFNNHAKGNFFIEKQMTIKMIQKCREKFHTFKLNDDNAAFGYYKESVAMQINDKQIRVIRTRKGDIVILNIDLHYENGDIMYLIAMENDIGYKKQVKWKIVDFMNAYEIKYVYNINNSKLPKSSRNMPRFRYAMRNPPVNVSFNVINETNFKDLPCKGLNKKTKIRISENHLKYYCRQSWNNGIMVPVVVVKGKKQWIEWKKFIRIYDQYHNKYQWFGVSLRYYPSNRQWKIECMDYDFGRMYYQYKLVGTNHNYCYKYNDLIGFVTTSLDIQ